MINGTINDDLEPLIPLTVRDAKGNTHWIEAAVDTGFNGFLTLPFADVSALGLDWLCRQDGMLADGSIQVFDVYSADVEWNGQVRALEVDCAEGVPLVGMRLMLGSRLEISVKVGGQVTIDAVP